MAMFISINGECVGVDTGPERGATRCNYSIIQKNVAFVFRDIFADKKKTGANFLSHLHFEKFERTQLQNGKHCAQLNVFLTVHHELTIYRVIHKSVKHFKNSQQIDYSTDHGTSYADRKRNSPIFFFLTYFTDAQCVHIC